MTDYTRGTTTPAETSGETSTATVDQTAYPTGVVDRDVWVARLEDAESKAGLSDSLARGARCAMSDARSGSAGANTSRGQQHRY
jgi:hypothetical protein